MPPTISCVLAASLPAASGSLRSYKIDTSTPFLGASPCTVVSVKFSWSVQLNQPLWEITGIVDGLVIELIPMDDKAGPSASFVFIRNIY